MIMSDSDFEIVDASTIDFVRRGGRRKGLGNGRNFIPAEPVSLSNDDREGQYLMYKAYQRNYQRRHGVTETPYDHLIDPVLQREEEYSKLFPITLIEARLIVQEESEGK